ncbi:MAG: class I SAM-dependent methyltransferase [Proteobacteria bacterium]|nr:class I SAM-dependent methyltransferase [Pseudomonadota bacterium]
MKNTEVKNTEDHWQSVMDYIGEAKQLKLGTFFSHMMLNNPRWVLFTFARYKFASKMIGQSPLLNILDLGCNAGYGTLLFTEYGHTVTGVDSDMDAIQWAKSNLGDKANFIYEDFLGKCYGKFDAVVSLDVIEHIKDGRKYFETVISNLKEDGFCIIGTINETFKPYASKIARLGHVNLFSAERLRDTARQYFKNVFLFGMNDEVVHTGLYPMCNYLFVLGVGVR